MKETRYTYNAEKENATFAVKLRDLFEIKDATHKELAEYIEEVTGESITRQAISQWCNGSTCPNLKTVPVIAEFFNVSTDYLLTDVKLNTTDPDFRAACKYTGLNEETVKRLHNHISCSSIVNRIVNSKIFFEIIYSMHELSIKSQRVMDWSMLFHNYKTTMKLTKMLNITYKQAEEIVRLYISDKYKMKYKLPQDSLNAYIPLEILNDDTECDTFRYKLIKCSEKISNLFDHREDFFKFTREELMEYLHITKEELKTLQEEARKYHSMADQDDSFDDMDTDDTMDDWFYESRTRHLQEEEAKEEQNNGEHNSTQE